jgi:hypothetical protein
MSNEQPYKRSAAPPESPPPDDLPDEISASLLAEDDPLEPLEDDWPAGMELPPSEAAYVPPMQVQTKDVDTWDLAEAIGIEAARVARYASSRNSTVIIDGGPEGEEPPIDIEMEDEGAPTEKMALGPAAKQDTGSAPGAPSESRRRVMTLTALIVAGAGLFLCAIYFLTRPGADSALPRQRVLSVTAPIAQKTLQETASTCPPCKASLEASQQRGIPTCALEREATAPSRAASSPREGSSKPGFVDPLFTVNPGY